jgi:hypothetical protein
MLVDNLERTVLIPLKDLRRASKWDLNLHAASVGQDSDHGKVE